MELYLETRLMTFEEESHQVEHEILDRISEEEYFGYDKKIELSEDDPFILNTRKIVQQNQPHWNNSEKTETVIYFIKEQKTWWNFPLYEVIENQIIPFDYTKYSYFAGNTLRRNVLNRKINRLYEQGAELKILRKTLKKVLDTLDIKDNSFEKMNSKIESVIQKYPKGVKLWTI